MSEDLVEKPFRSAADQVAAEHQQAVADVKSKIEKAKSEALKKVSG